MFIKQTSLSVRAVLQRIRVSTAYLSPILFGLSAACLHAAPEGAQRAEGDFYLKDGDRVVFYGDSITERRIYSALVETYVVTRFPTMDVSFVHSGWGGDRVSGGAGGDVDTRLKRDVFPYDPTVVTLMFGMNDGAYKPWNQATGDTYRNGIAYIMDQLTERSADTRFTLIRPSPYDDVTRQHLFDGGYNAVMIRFGDAVEELALERGQQVANLNSTLVDVLEQAQARDTYLATRIIGDRIHPGQGGNLAMAMDLLDAWGAPSLVTAVTLEAEPADGGLKVLEAENTTVSDLKQNGGTLTWTQLDRALPLPIDFSDDVTGFVAEASGAIDRLDRQPLRVIGLSAPYYALSIDGAPVGVFTKAQLAEGINLAILPTPMLRQAEQVHYLTWRRTNSHHMRWRTIQVPNANPKSEELAAAMPGILAAFDAETETIRREQRQTAQPITRHYELSPQEEILSVYGLSAPMLPEGLGPNLALNKGWVASSTNRSGWNSGLTDGSWSANRGTTFASDNDATFPKTVTVDLEQPASLSCVVFGVPPFGSTRTVAVSLSEDGNDFREVGRHTFRQKLEEKRIVSFEPQNARYVRLTYEDHYPTPVNYERTFVFTTELQAYGKEGR